jgi:hypothetical protein
MIEGYEIRLDVALRGSRVLARSGNRSMLATRSDMIWSVGEVSAL